MRDNAERVRLARRRAAVLERRLERYGIGALGALCFALAVALTAALGAVMEAENAVLFGASGAMLLYENAGGYVLVGVIAFTAAVVITVACMRYREKLRRKTQTKEESEE